MIFNIILILLLIVAVFGFLFTTLFFVAATFDWLDQCGSKLSREFAYAKKVLRNVRRS